jgi:hypothetical protein
LPRTKISNDQGILKDLALSVAAANPRQVDERRFEHSRRLGVVTAAERRSTRRKSGCDLAWRQAAILVEALQPCDASLHASFVTGRGFCESGVEIGKSEAGAREMALCMRHDLGPFVMSGGDAS